MDAATAFRRSPQSNVPTQTIAPGHTSLNASCHRTAIWNRRWIAGILAAAFFSFPYLGCRAISKFGESRQSVAARRLSRQGLTAARQGDWRSAETLFTNALDLSGNNDAAHRGLGETLWQRGQTEEAIKHLRQAVQLSAGDPKHLQRLGRMYLELGRVDEASRQCEIALQSDREWAAAWALWGDCEAAHGRDASALAAYHRALSLQPDYPYVQIRVAEIYHEQGRNDRLLATLDRLNPNPTNNPNQSDGGMIAGRADLLRGLAMRKIGRHDEATQYLMAAAEANPADVTARLQLASGAIATGRTSLAQDYLAQAMRIDPEAVAASGWVRTGIQANRSLNSVNSLATDDEETIEIADDRPLTLPKNFREPSRVAVFPDVFDSNR